MLTTSKLSVLSDVSTLPCTARDGDPLHNHNHFSIIPWLAEACFLLHWCILRLADRCLSATSRFLCGGLPRQSIMTFTLCSADNQFHAYTDAYPDCALTLFYVLDVHTVPASFVFRVQPFYQDLILQRRSDNHLRISPWQ